MSNQPQPPQQQLNIKIDEKVGEGVYANLFVITHSPSEFILDFGRIVPGIPDAKIYSRVMTTPTHAKQLMMLLQQNIEAYEKQNGEIKFAGQPENKSIGFKSEGQNS
ncbi:MAG TPA: DUF3467 domain-containing protein [Candidatus Cloacimonadota bacterium]|nr:DUF3467 domain-containing protein [Candidatus Cloacimonadota bacterium]HPT71918.1 DUF3467 domain-containing protein [Candidatus Cloacimonadota bacterium]